MGIFQKPIKILAIESSCDDTSAAVVFCDENASFTVLSNVINSQIQIHNEFGGVVPEVASRAHIQNISNVTNLALSQAFPDGKIALDAVACTYSPGLVGSLLVGVNFAKAFAYSQNLPLIAVNHIEGHICANYIENPHISSFLALVVSGGHSSIIEVNDYQNFSTLAKTVDDAAGEAFDKIARLLGLGYPGGPAIEKAAIGGNPHAFPLPEVKIPNSDNFSFSGVKTAMINLIHNKKITPTPNNISDIAASFQHAVCNVLATRTVSLARKNCAKTVAICGGVACNKYLRNLMENYAAPDINVISPKPIFCTDNAAMIGIRGAFQYHNNDFAGLDLNAKPTGK